MQKGEPAPSDPPASSASCAPSKATPVPGTGDKVDDGFPYPFPITPSTGFVETTAEGGLTFLNAMEAVAFLYQSAGLLAKPPRAAPTSSSSSSTTSIVVDEAVRQDWFTYKTQVLPGGIVMKLVDSIVVPTPKGPQFTTSRRVLTVYDRRYLLEYESPETLSQFTYTELDEMRYAYLAVADLLVDGKVFAGKWELTGLAKRDIKKNNTEEAMAKARSAGGEGGAAAAAKSVPNAKGMAGGGTGSSGLVKVAADRPKADATQKHMKAILEDDCVARWPHTPATKSAAITVESDPKQPRHKPLYKATVTLMYCSNAKIEGPWMGNKRDAEDAAAELALRRLSTMKK